MSHFHRCHECDGFSEHRSTKCQMGLVDEKFICDGCKTDVSFKILQSRIRMKIE